MRMRLLAHVPLLHFTFEEVTVGPVRGSQIFAERHKGCAAHEDTLRCIEHTPGAAPS